MTKTSALSQKERQMLELLAEGASTKTLARKMGYSEGTVRVYLHNLYRTLGVRNRTEAVLWQIRRMQSQPQQAIAPAPVARAVMPAPPSPAIAEESFGDVALREGLLGALGIMESFIGPYGRVWEIGERLKDEPMDAAATSRRDTGRTLWRALLAGDFEYGKRLYDRGDGQRLMAEAPALGILLVLLLQLGGYSHAADTLAAQAPNRRSLAREMSLVSACREVMLGGSDAALGTLFDLASDPRTTPAFRQVSIAALYYAYRARHDTGRARGAADALWAEAESARAHLEAMGVRPLARVAALPRPAHHPDPVETTAEEAVTSGR